jgi:acetolactate synthase-1/2/3 large subunit
MIGRTSAPVAEVVADLLVEAGVRRAYTVPGESFLPLLEAFDAHPKLQVVSTRHEGGAAFMAEADGKLTGTPAVVMATRAVGTANLSVGIHTAYQDSTPMLALLGQVETDHLGNEAFQEVDLPAFLDQITVWASTVTRRDRVGSTVARALARCTTGRPGPAAVALPSDVLEGEAAYQSPILGQRPRSAPHGEDLDAAERLLRQAQRPVAIVGQGSSHDAMVAFAEEYGVGVYSAFRRQDCYPNSHEQYLGHLTLGTAPAILEGLEKADLVVVLGERLDEVTTQSYRFPAAETRVVHVHDDPGVFGQHRRADLALTADPADFCARLAGRAQGGAGRRAEQAWWKPGHAAYLAVADAAARLDDEGRLHPGRAIRALQAAAPTDTVIVNDAGNFSVYLHRQWMFEQPHTQAAPISGAMGYAVPGAVGAALAKPGSPVLAVAGDGGFLMTATELETAVRLGTDIKVLVLQNRLYGTIAMHQARAGNAVSACDIGDVDLAGLARSLGAHALECTHEDQLADAAGELMTHEGPAVMVVRTDPDVIAPGTSLAALTGAAR